MRMFAYPKQAEVNRVVPKIENLRARQAIEAGQGTLRVRGRRDSLEIQTLAGNN